MPIDVRRSWSRFVTEGEGRRTAHSFSFGAHYDPENLGFGALIALNDDVLQPGAGYPAHPHRDTEIVTWVLSGALRHTDDLGHTHIVEPGQVQVVSAGKGIVHAEVNAAGDETRFIQAWIRPDEPDLVPHYTLADAPLGSDWTQLVGGEGIGINTAGASLYAVQLGPRDSIDLPDAPHLHLFVAEGALGIGERELRAGATARLRDQGGRRIHADGTPTQVMVWAQSDTTFCK